MFVFADFLLFSFGTVICDDIDRRMDTVYWPRAEVVAGKSSINNASLISSYPRSNVDVILSLKNPAYGPTMMRFFQFMGKKTDNTPEVESFENRVAKAALIYFKGGAVAATTSTVRFFKPKSRYEADGTLVEVDEKAALTSEFFLSPTVHAQLIFMLIHSFWGVVILSGPFMTEIRNDMNRRMDSAKVWLKANDVISMIDVDEKNAFDVAKILPSLPQDQQQGFTQSPVFASHEKMMKFSAETKSAVQSLPLDVAEINIDEGLLEKQRSEVVTEVSSNNSSNSTKQGRMQPPEYTTNEKKRKRDKHLDVADMNVVSLLDEMNADVGTRLSTNNHSSITKQAPSPPEKKRKIINALQSLQLDFANVNNLGEGLQHRSDEHVIARLSPINNSDDAKQGTTQPPASVSNEKKSRCKAQSNIPLDVAEINVDEIFPDMGSAVIVAGVSSTSSSKNVKQETPHERKIKPRTDCSREIWLHADDDIALRDFNDRNTPDAEKISVSLPHDQRQEFTQSPASATNEEMIKYTAESNNSVQMLPLDVAEINVDEGLLEKPKADVVTGVFPNNISNNTIQGTMQSPTSATNEKKIKPRIDCKGASKLLSDTHPVVSENINDKSFISPHPRPNVDIILSLKDPVYNSVMMKYFQLKGEKTNYTEEAGVKDMANEALLTFKNRNTIGETCEEGHAPMTATATTTVRFFKPKSIYIIDGKFEEVDEKAAFTSEFFLIPTVHSQLI